MRSDAREILARAKARPRPRPWIPVQPFPKQAEFLALEADEALYGGAAGGGKSEALLMWILAPVAVPGYSALILRRTFRDLALPGAIMDRARTWLDGTDAHWNGIDKRWTFPGGASVAFGYLDNERDKYRYQSAEFQRIAFDELTQFPPDWYRYLFTRLRRKRSIPVPTGMRAGTNPGGIGHAWVKERFIDAPEDRAFVKATFLDNPHVDHEEYARMIDRADPTTARQMRGEWIQNSGGLVYLYDRERNELGELPPGRDPWVYVLGIDYGFTDSTAFAVLAWRQNDPCVYVVTTHKRKGMTPSDAAEHVRELNARCRFSQMVGDTGGLGKGYVEEARKRFSLPIVAAQKQDKRGYIDLLNGDLVGSRLKVLRGNEELLKEIAILPWNEDRSAPADGFEDHIADAVLYAWRACGGYAQRTPPPKPQTKAEQIRAETAEYHEREDERVSRDGAKEWWDE